MTRINEKNKYSSDEAVQLPNERYEELLETESTRGKIKKVFKEEITQDYFNEKINKICDSHRENQGFSDKIEGLFEKFLKTEKFIDQTKKYAKEEILISTFKSVKYWSAIVLIPLLITVLSSIIINWLDK